MSPRPEELDSSIPIEDIYATPESKSRALAYRIVLETVGVTEKVEPPKGSQSNTVKLIGLVMDTNAEGKVIFIHPLVETRMSNASGEYYTKIFALGGSGFEQLHRAGKESPHIIIVNWEEKNGKTYTARYNPQLAIIISEGGVDLRPGGDGTERSINWFANDLLNLAKTKDEDNVEAALKELEEAFTAAGGLEEE